MLASELAGLLRRVFSSAGNSGTLAGEAGILRLSPGLIWIPDLHPSCSRSSTGTTIGAAVLRFFHSRPDLAVEVLGEGNTRREMARKCGNRAEFWLPRWSAPSIRTRTVAVDTLPRQAHHPYENQPC